MKKITGLLTLVLLWCCNNQQLPESSLLYYIPPESQVILKISDLSTLKSDLKNNQFLQSARNTSTSNSIIEASSLMEYLAYPEESILAFVPGDNSNADFIYATKFHDSIFNRALLDSTAIIDNRNFKTIELGEKTYYSEEHRGTLVVSSSSDLLQQTTGNAGKVAVDPKINSLYAAASETPSATVILKVSAQSPVGKTLFGTEFKSDYSEFAQWVSFDVNTGQDHITLNGITLPSSDSTGILSLFRNTKALVHRTPMLAPGNTIATLSYTFDSHQEFVKNQVPMLANPAALDSVFNTVEEIGHIYIGKNKAVVMQTYGTENITSFLEDQRKSVNDYQGKEIIALKEPRFLNVQFHPLVQDFEANYYTIIENAFVFAPQQDILQGIIRNYNSGNTFGSQSFYSDLTTSLADEAHINFLSTASGISTILEENISQDILRDFNKIKPGQFTYAAQVIGDDHFYHTNLAVKKIGQEARANTATALFSVQLDDEVAGKPQFVLNHRTREKEIVVQDQSNVLYLISNKGKILWKKDVGGPVQGEIQQVDLYRNGRLQLAFTTNSQFFVLDRNGKIVQPFSKKYPGGNLNPLAVFDYENNRNYRLVVTQGNKVFMYNNRGDIVKGFTYTEAPSPIMQAPKHFRIGNRDYLVFVLEDGTLEILNRVGKTRIPVDEKIDFSGNPVFLYNDKITVSNKKGRLYQIDTKGKLSTTRLNLNEYHGMDATIKSLATMDDNTLTIKGRRKNLDLGVYTAPKIFYIYDTIYVSVTDLQSQKVYMYYSNARSLPGFPVYGASAVDLADMDNDRKLELVAKDQEQSLVVYRLN